MVEISVVMPVYNGEKYLREAIDSILNQTFRDFEFIIVNDGSTDSTEEIILSYSDPRIVYVKNEENLQIVKTLNKGIAMAKGKYIARMDADDISMPERFEKQYQFMEENPEVGLCGTWLRTFGEFVTEWSYPVNDVDIKVSLMFFSPIVHASIMCKRSLFEFCKYEDDFNKAEDYRLWSVLKRKSIVFHNLPINLYLYRQHEKMTCVKQKPKQTDNSNKIRLELLNEFGMQPTIAEMQTHIKISRYQVVPYKEAEAWFIKLLEHNRKTNYFDQKAFEGFVKKHWFRIVSINAFNGLSVLWYYFFVSNLPINFNIIHLSKLCIKALIKWQPRDVS